MSTHKYTGPDLRRGKIGQSGEPLKTGDTGNLTGGKRGGLQSFVRENDGKAFWVVPQHLARRNVDE